MMSCFCGMRFATVEIMITTLEVVTMHHNKETQQEIVVLEAAVWTFWVFFFGVGYLLTKVAF